MTAITSSTGRVDVVAVLDMSAREPATLPDIQLVPERVLKMPAVTSLFAPAHVYWRA
jgi:hypothetical protein